MTFPRFADHLQHLGALRAAALRAVDPAAAVQRALQPSDFAGAERIFVVGAGKAGAAMAQAAAGILGDRLTQGVVTVPNLPAQAPDRVTFIEGGHPVPNAGSLAAGRALADLLARTTSRDLVLALISGGGSALLELPHPHLTLTDLQAVNTALLKCGAPIGDINAVRAALSQLKGGGLARLAAPARVLALILSDVVGNDLSVIASGLTVSAAASRSDALAVIDQYRLRSALPVAVIQHLTHADKNAPAVSSAAVENRLIAFNRLAGEAAAAEARRLGFSAEFIADDWQGEARELGKRFAALITSAPGPLSIASGDGEGGGVAPQEPGWGVRNCFIVGGEATVTVRGGGRGGRNTEAALAAALALDGIPNVALAAFATDGVDGPTDAAGAVARGDSVTRARALGLDPAQALAANDSYSFFAALGDLILTGPTGTNVNDLMFGLVY